MTRLQLVGVAALAAQLSYAHPRRPMGAFTLADLRARDGNDQFVFAAIGDSWGSGVEYGGGTKYDDDSSGCHRLKNAWATVVRDEGPNWGPEGFPPQLCFEACSGRKMEHMGEELDKCADRRPEITIMEVSGNNADFYPAADNCMFHKFGYGYGTLYEKDDPQNPQGSCRKSIAEVKENIKRIEEEYKSTINMWKGHRASQSNDASLFTIGYGRFFGMNDECDSWDFAVPVKWFTNPLLWPEPQTIKKAMRQEFNDMVDSVNQAIRSATESFNDPKIQYIDINPAFDNHRFCEPGHSYWDQLNYGSKVWLWNQPTKYFLTLKKGDETVSVWDSKKLDLNADDVAGFEHDEKDVPTKDGEDVVAILRNKDKPDQILEIRFNPDQVEALDSIARTLHPTGDGHHDMGMIIVNKLKETKWPPPNQDLDPLPPVNNKALSIMMEKDGDNYNWVFYETPRGESAGCNTDKKPVFKGPNFTGVNIDEPPNPSGDYNMDVWGRPCKWVGDGNSPGQLICNDEHISCQTHTADAKTIDCPNSGRKQHEGAFCEFYLVDDTTNPPPTEAPAVPTSEPAPTSPPR